MSRASAAVALAFSLSWEASAAGGGDMSARPRFVAYLPSYRVKSLDSSLVSHVDELVLFSVEPLPDGGLDLKHLGPGVLRSARRLAKGGGVEMSVCAGGWGRSGGFARATADARTRGRFVSELLRFCRENGFAGIDFDWEFPRDEKQKRAYVDLLAETKRAFAPHGMRVTVALGHTQDIGREGYAAVDRVHVMAYDHRGRHSTFEQAKADAERVIRLGAPREKVLLGVPFYGRDVARRDATTYADIVKRHAPGPDVDEVGGVYFNGIATIRRKAAWARETGLGGVFAWEIGQDAPGPRSLAKAVREELDQPAEPAEPAEPDEPDEPSGEARP